LAAAYPKAATSPDSGVALKILSSEYRPLPVVQFLACLDLAPLGRFQDGHRYRLRLAMAWCRPEVPCPGFQPILLPP